MMLNDITLWLEALLSFNLATLDQEPLTVGRLLLALVTFWIGWQLARLLSRRAKASVIHHLKFTVGEAAAVETLLFYVFVVLLALLALHLARVPLTIFTLAGGAVAIGVGFGSQAIVSNFIAGLILLFERPIRVGDLVQVDTNIGRVQSIGARSVHILTADRVEIIVPNSKFLDQPVINWTFTDQRLRCSITVGAAYTSNCEKVRETLLKVADQHPAVLKDPMPYVNFQDFGESALIFRLFFFISLDAGTPAPIVESDLRFKVAELFRVRGIEIPFPQRTISLVQKEPLRVEMEPESD